MARSAEAATARPHRFGESALPASAAIPALDRMNERLARALRQRIEPLARVKTRVEPQPLDCISYGAWQARQPEAGCLALYSLRPLRGTIMLSVPPLLVTRLVDAYYGGSGDTDAAPTREPSATEEAMVRRLLEGIADALIAIWSESISVEAQLRSRETSASFAALASAEDPIAIAGFAIRFGRSAPAIIEILYPVAALREIEPLLAGSTTADDSSAVPAVWRDAIAAAVGGVRVEARTVLARPTLSAAALLRLAVGDVIPVTLGARVPLIVGQRTIATGIIGESDGHAALSIQTMGFHGDRT